jgi:predicted  nucleic acid-binding Zn-ribbon protein
MNKVQGHLAELERLANALLSDYLLVKRQNQQLKGEINEHKLLLKNQEQEIQRLEKELSNAKLAKGLAQNEEDAKQAKAKLSSLMREIDRCIAMLNE